MKIKIQVFASLRDYFDETFDLEVAEGLNISDILDIISIKSPMAIPVLRKCRVAINENFVAENYKIGEADHLFIIPPSSGG